MTRDTVSLIIVGLFILAAVIAITLEFRL